MTDRLSFEESLERKHEARMRRDEKAFERLCAREDAAAAMVGELASGKHYVYPAGGRYREGTRRELIDFLIRNQYA
ncbi:MAG TPA: hypothetical protein VK955_04615 [Xanthobacteraceae bacterium]|nr:hypothetical protein [Xanthobacteraceae bacterium]